MWSSSFFAAKVRSTSACRPKTLTSWWPVKVSSMIPLSSPVAAHCRTKSFWLRLPIAAVTSTEIGMDTSATSARSQEIQNIIPRTAKTVSSELSSCERVCCSDIETLSMSLVTRLSSSPRGWPSK